MILDTSLVWSACTAIATASQLLPVPAGPIPNVMTFWRIASTYRFWPAVLGRTGFPFAPRINCSVSTALGRWSSSTMSIERRTAVESSVWPCCTSMTNSSNSLPTS
ncbi:unannotated protein [freshwater metagenome]|uniref:Unannotated protein n=1 Tax=freshwater metagenome TaxID=449393 RepID=A0A6J6X4H5_9ZZZZ